MKQPYKKHSDNAIIEQLGRATIMEHFKCSRRIVQLWSVQGIPERHRQTIKLLAANKGININDFDNRPV